MEPNLLKKLLFNSNGSSGMRIQSATNYINHHAITFMSALICWTLYIMVNEQRDKNIVESIEAFGILKLSVLFQILQIYFF